MPTRCSPWTKYARWLPTPTMLATNRDSMVQWNWRNNHVGYRLQIYVPRVPRFGHMPLVGFTCTQQEARSHHSAAEADKLLQCSPTLPQDRYAGCDMPNRSVISRVTDSWMQKSAQPLDLGKSPASVSLNKTYLRREPRSSVRASRGCVCRGVCVHLVVAWY